MKSGQLKDKVAVVLGASASGGTGWAIAEALAGEGAKVVVAARSRAPLEVLAGRIGGRAVVCDAGNEAQIAALMREAVAAFGPLDIAVNAAGRPVMGLTAEATATALQQSLDVNYLGNVHFINYAAAAMNNGGSITLFSSVTAAQPAWPHFAYACARAASDCLVRHAAMEYGPRGIRINSILPGPIKSDATKERYAIPGFEKVRAREVPLGRVGMPRDYANAVLWLAGSAFITGACLPVSGGNQLTRLARADELPSMPAAHPGADALQ